MENISPAEFNMEKEKNMSFLVVPKSPKVWNKVAKIGLGSFKDMRAGSRLIFDTMNLRIIMDDNAYKCHDEWIFNDCYYLRNWNVHHWLVVHYRGAL